MITSLQFTNFRNFDHLLLNDFKQINYISGHNGIGKTNILDGITRFMTSTGLKNQPTSACINMSAPQKGWGIHMKYHIESQDHYLSVGVPPHKKQRILQYYGEKISTADIYKMLPCLWLTPMIETLFLSDSMDIRRYFHHIVSLFFSQFLTSYQNYEKLCKERMRLLLKEDGHIDMTWVSVIEKQISEIAIECIIMRHDFMVLLKEHSATIDNNLSAYFAPFLLSFECQTSDIRSALEYQQLLQQNRITDQNAKRTLFGIHRVRWKIYHTQKNIDLSFCSTGEQKSVMAGLLFYMNHLFIHVKKQYPLLLLDDIFSHFDQKKIGFIQEYCQDLNNIIFLTGTEFHNISDSKTNHINLEEYTQEHLLF